MQFHYVVIYDDTTRSWSVDYESMGLFNEGEVWDNAAEEWLCAHGQDTSREVTDTYDEAADMLSDLLGRFVGFPGYHTPKAGA